MIFSIMGTGLLFRSVTQFLLLVVSSQVFPPEQIGVAAILYATYHLVWAWFETAITQTYIQINDGETARLETLGSFARFACLFTVTIVAALYFVFERLAPGFGVWASGLIIATILLRTACVLSHSDLLKTLRIKPHALIEQGSYVVGFWAGLAICIHFDFGILYMVLGMFLNSLIACILFRFVNKISFKPRIHKESFADVMRLASGFFVGSGLNTFVREANVLFAGALFSTSAAAYYSRGIQLYMLGAITVGQLFDRLLTPIFRRNIVRNEDNAEMFALATTILLAGCIPASAFIYLNAAAIIQILFGEGWEGVVPVLKVLALVLGLRTALKINEATLRAYGQAWRRVFFYLAWAGILILGVLPAKQFGLIGLASLEVLGVVIFWLLSSTYASRLVKLGWGTQLLAILTSLPGLLIFISTHLMLMNYLADNLWLRLSIEVAVLFSVSAVQILTVTKFRFGSVRALLKFR